MPQKGQSYTDIRLAACYDHVNTAGPDLDFHEELSGFSPIDVIDVGSGTGRLALRLADRGHRVTGLEPAPGMLAAARAKPGADRVRWIEGRASELSLPERFDLAIMTGHVFQVFLDDAEVAAVLANIRAHLKPGGILAFDTRNPLVQEWRSWRPDQWVAEAEIPGHGRVRVHNDIVEAAGELVTFTTHFDFGGGDLIVDPITIRFMPQATLARLLAEAGFADVTWYGDFDRSAVTDTSPELIVLARR